jgi:MFS family permease
MSTSPLERLPRSVTVVLGLSVVVGFGVWFYGYGVLLEPIGVDTGWAEGLLSSTYGASMFGAGVLATVVGRLLPRNGSRAIYGVGAAVVLPAYFALAQASSPWLFVIVGIAAGSITGALGYYAAVHTIIALLVPPAARARTITTNTLWGAMASPVFLPLMAWLVLEFDWRTTLRLTGAAVAGVFALVAVAVPDIRGEAAVTASLRAAIASAVSDRTTRAVLATTLIGGVVTAIVVLYQVPVMVTAGLTLAVASSLAGARGFMQLGGRIPMPWMIARFGSRTTLRGAHLLTGVACLMLPFTGAPPIAVVFALVAGLAIGALVPVESIFTADIIPTESLGVVLGVASLARGVGAALGPALGGGLASAADSRTPTLVVAAFLTALAAAIVPIIRSRPS